MNKFYTALLGGQKKSAAHVKIFWGMFLGIAWGLLAISFGWDHFTTTWVKPFGDIFLKMLKLIAVPIVFLTLVDGISNLHDLAKLSRIGAKTIGTYLITTVVAIVIGLLVVNAVSPGKYLSANKREAFRELYAQDAKEKMEMAEQVRDSGPLRFITDIVPDNIFSSFSQNKNMLQVIFFSFLLGITMVMLPQEKIAPVKTFFSSLSTIFLEVVSLVMRYAPIGVFALLAGLLVKMGADSEITSLFAALGAYVLCVLFSLALMVFVVYPLVIRFLVRIPYMRFAQAILPAQLLAFTTSSSAATLPVTMRQVEGKLGVSKKISSFVLPLGATINMDGTSIHQAISAVFIAQAFGIHLSLEQQLLIVLTATLSSIGAAAVPSAGLIMLVIVLSAVGINPEGLALIVALDRPLDMCRTVVNVTGDATVAAVIGRSEGELRKTEA